MTQITQGGKVLKNRARAIADYCRVPLDKLFTAAPPEQLNSNTIRKTQHMLSALLSKAVQKGIIRFNPMLNTEPIKAQRIPATVMNNEQAQLFKRLLKGVENINVRALLMTALCTGMRSGELRALQWEDVDTQRGIINVNKNLDNKNRITTPKTKSSTRYVNMIELLPEFLEHYHNELQAYITAMHGRVADNGIVFPAITTGEYMNSSYPNKVIKQLIRGTELPQDLHIHSLRHTFTSLMINSGADAKVVQTTLGHSSVSTTQDIYSHVFAETLAKSMKRVGRALTDGNDIFGK